MCLCTSSSTYWQLLENAGWEEARKCLCQKASSRSHIYIYKPCMSLPLLCTRTHATNRMPSRYQGFAHQDRAMFQGDLNFRGHNIFEKFDGNASVMQPCRGPPSQHVGIQHPGVEHAPMRGPWPVANVHQDHIGCQGGYMRWGIVQYTRNRKRPESCTCMVVYECLKRKLISRQACDCGMVLLIFLHHWQMASCQSAGDLEGNVIFHRRGRSRGASFLFRGGFMGIP